MRAIGLGTLVVALAGCALAPSVLIDAADAPVPPFPECVADQYAFVGETTMSALGVSRPSGRPPPDPNRVGMIWITADRRPNEGEPGGQVLARMLCIEFQDDGGQISAMTNFPVVDSWEPPGSSQGNQVAGALPSQQLVAVGLAVLLLIVVSLVAFRRPR
jgi:hypothetical protein